MTETSERQLLAPSTYRAGDPVAIRPGEQQGVPLEAIGRVTSVIVGGGFDGGDLLNVTWPDGTTTSRLAGRHMLADPGYEVGSQVVLASPCHYTMEPDDPNEWVDPAWHGATGTVTHVGGSGVYDISIPGRTGSQGVHFRWITPVSTAAPEEEYTLAHPWPRGTRVLVSNPAYYSPGEGYVAEEFFGQVCEVMSGPASETRYVVRHPRNGTTNVIHQDYLTPIRPAEETAPAPLDVGDRVVIGNPAYVHPDGTGSVLTRFYGQTGEIRERHASRPGLFRVYVSDLGQQWIYETYLTRAGDQATTSGEGASTPVPADVAAMTEDQMRAEIARIREERRTLQDRVSRAVYEKAVSIGWCSDFERGMHDAGLPLPVEELTLRFTVPIALRGVRGVGSGTAADWARRAFTSAIIEEKIAEAAADSGYAWVTTSGDPAAPTDPWAPSSIQVEVVRHTVRNGETR